MQPMRIYADNAATTKMSAAAIHAMLPYMEEIYGNPSSLYEFGQLAKEALENARSRVAGCLGCEAREIIFTSGGSEADNQALFTAARLGERKGKKHIISTAFEHHAILHTLEKLKKQGFEITLLDVHRDGLVTAQQVRDAIREDTCLVTIMYANNEIGTIQPIAEIGAVCREKGVLFHTDAVQGFLKIPFSAKNLGADLISVSSHKVHGPKGAGALYISPRLKSFPPLLYGGGQEGGYRSGTEGTPALFAFAAACSAVSGTLKDDISQEKELLDGFVEKASQLPEIVVNGAHEAPHILNLSVPGIPVQNIINLLQDADICVSAGSACAKGHRSHVLQAMGVSPEVIDASFRISLSRESTPEDLDALYQVLKEQVIPRR